MGFPNFQQKCCDDLEHVDDPYVTNQDHFKIRNILTPLQKDLLVNV
jgi:hypothetical protein